MNKTKFTLISFLATCIFLASCSNHQSGEENKAILDTVSLSSRGLALAYQDGDKIVATSIDTMKQISFGGATEPAISPDGNKLAYTVSDTVNNLSIWVADMENKSQQQLKVSSGNFHQPVWSPDGSTIAFSMLNGQKRWKAGLIKTDNTGFVQLDAPSETAIYAPVWKSDKELVAQDLVNIYTFNYSGKLTGTVKIAGLIGPNLSITTNTRFFYSHDGTKLIFNATDRSLKVAEEALYLTDLNSKKTVRISPEGQIVPYVFVTADDRIFFSGVDQISALSKIYVSDLDGQIKTIVNQGTNPTGALK